MRSLTGEYYAHCFVIQPFDRGKFDKRYENPIKPAIEAASLTPYRVDRDPSAHIPIEKIEEQISQADVCLAEITTDNPNVWYELGFAIASGKPVCLICSIERTASYPFDVQHRNILRYAVDAPEDFTKAGQAITDRLKALVEQKKTSWIASLQPTVSIEGLSAHEIAALSICAGLNAGTGIDVSNYERRMEQAGFSDIGAGVALHSLIRSDLLDKTEVSRSDDHGNEWVETVLTATREGINWLLRTPST
jgi:hypothetical protein